MNHKKRLMVIVGAGASIELGMPSVNEIDELFCQWSLEEYRLANDQNQSLYSFIRDEINKHYSLNPKTGLIKKTDFEQVLYVILQLSAALSDDNYNLPTNAFFDLKKLPTIISYQKEKLVDGNDLRQLYLYLIDKLAIEFRERCKRTRISKQTDFEYFEKFITRLNSEYDTAFISLNYDDLVIQTCQDLFTGFNKDTGAFESCSVYNRRKWGLIYYLHGSVHFDMQGDQFDMHAIKWNRDLNSQFQSNSSGRNSQDTLEGIQMPTSTIVVGYGKTNQIQRIPFRTYYSQLDKIAESSDAILFLGYGFNDLHINKCLHSIRHRKRQVLIIDLASDNQDPMQFRRDMWAYNLCQTIPVNASEMATKQYKNIAPEVRLLKRDEEFEISTNPAYPLAVWYGGFINACKNYKKIQGELSL